MNKEITVCKELRTMRIGDVSYYDQDELILETIENLLEENTRYKQDIEYHELVSEIIRLEHENEDLKKKVLFDVGMKHHLEGIIYKLCKHKELSTINMVNIDKIVTEFEDVKNE